MTVSPTRSNPGEVASLSPTIEPTPSPAATVAASPIAANDTGLDGFDGVAMWPSGEALLGGVAGSTPSVARLDNGSWTTIGLPHEHANPSVAQSVSVAAVDARVAWALFRCEPIFHVVVGCFAGVFRSQDGGATWTRRSIVIGLSRLSFADARHGWGTAEDAGNPNIGGFYATDDGAAHWHRLAWPCPTGFELRGIARASETFGWVACTGEPATIMEARVIRVTNDAGKTWKTIAENDPSSGKRIGSVGSSGHLAGIAALPDGHLWSWADRGVLEASVDGGVTWHPLPLGEPDVATVESASFADADHGMAIVWDGGDARAVLLERTDDGGQTWAIVASVPIR